MLGFKLLYINVYKYIYVYVYKSLNPNIFSDLRKPGLVPGESLSLSTKIDSVLENNLSYSIIFIAFENLYPLQSLDFL